MGSPVRQATDADVEELIRLAAVMITSMGLDASPDDWRRAARRVLREELASGTKAAFVVDDPDGGGLIANAAGSIMQSLPTVWNDTGRYGYVQWVATDPEFRGRGHSRAVMEALLNWYRAEGVEIVELRATPDGEPLYRSLGFSETETPALRVRVS